jgi:hypothetical protein
MSKFDDFKKKFALETNKDIPQDVVDLPSGFGKATIIPMKVKEQKDFLKALEKQDEYLINEAFDKILIRCVIFINGNPCDIDALCIQDRSYLLLMIRKLTNPKAKISHICPVSEKVYTNIEIDMTTLETEKFEGTSLTKEELVSLNIKILLGPVYRKDEKDVEKWLKSKSKDKSVIDKKYCGYAAVVKEIFIRDDENSDWQPQQFSFDNKVEFITEMCSQTVTASIDEFIKTLNFGIKTTFNFKSDEFEGEQEAMLISFFME